MPENPDTTERDSLIDKLANLEGRDTGDSRVGGRRPLTGGLLPETSTRCGRAIPSSAKLAAFDLINADTSTGERRLFALIDAACCVLTHSNHYGGQETARLALETVVHPAVAREAVRILTADS
ncbi:MAG: hypothetical protein DLM59_03695 [Pseudonocardiales bacterium]|nr:MAG: hypothetical protein DLM59_03695 [Pseudonocardiales bacterium]